MFPIKDDIPTRRFPVLTVAIIAICCAVYFLFEHGLWDLGATGNERVLEYGAIPYEITHPGRECAEAAGQLVCEGQPGVSGTAPDQAPWWVTIFTSMFMHGSLLHLAGNMLFLWIFGNNIVDSMDELGFVAFYQLGGVIAVAALVLVDPNAPVPTGAFACPQPWTPPVPRNARRSNRSVQERCGTLDDPVHARRRRLARPATDPAPERVGWNADRSTALGATAGARRRATWPADDPT